MDLYFKISIQSSSKKNPDVIRVANLIGHSPSSVNMKVSNFASFDETLQKQGIVGLKNTSRLDKQIWDEFSNDRNKLISESQRLMLELYGRTIEIKQTSLPLEISDTMQGNDNSRYTDRHK